MANILWFQDIGMGDLPQVGGKNASLGEMVSNLADLGVKVPGGFATTADAYRGFLAAGGLRAVTAGQAAVLYDGARVLGGGWIRAALRDEAVESMANVVGSA